MAAKVPGCRLMRVAFSNAFLSKAFQTAQKPCTHPPDEEESGQAIRNGAWEQ